MLPSNTSMSADIPNPAPNLESREWPIDGTLDLHLFKPAEVGELVPG